MSMAFLVNDKVVHSPLDYTFRLNKEKPSDRLFHSLRAGPVTLSHQAVRVLDRLSSFKNDIFFRFCLNQDNNEHSVNTYKTL